MIKDSAGNQRFYGVYRAVVFNNQDPEALGRLRLKIPQIFAETPTGWCWPVNPAGISLSSPAIGQGIWAMFEGGDPSFPLWLGVFGLEVSSSKNIAINPVLNGTPIPDNFSFSSTNTSNNIDIVKSLISVASAIDGGNA